MKTIVVYDSTFGNTKEIAEAIAGAMPDGCEAVHCRDITPDAVQSAELLIIGCPTHAGHPTESLQKLMKSIESLDGCSFASFDTRVPWWWAKIFGFAAGRTAKKLRKKGARQLGEPSGFFVADKEGPVQEGECERAATWAKEVLTALNG